MLTGWKAVYQNGGELPQYNEDGSENKYDDIDRKNLSQFMYVIDDKPRLVVHMNKTKRLIYRRRVAQAFFDNKITEVVYLIGWQETILGRNTQMISFLFEDGHVEVVDKFDEDHQWFYPVKFRSDEA
jgi:hypothetical protein